MSIFTDYPTAQFKRSRWFYPVYDGVWLLLLLGVLVAVRLLDFRGLVPSFAEFHWEYLLGFPVLLYVLILGNVFAHNVAHRNFPKPLNRLVGELAGALVLSRYASWEILHLRHHRYADQVGKDPHDCRPGYWNFFGYFLLNVEAQLAQSFLEAHGGATPGNIAFNRARATLSFLTGVVLIYTFLALLGPPLFLLMFLPAQVITILHLAHFNWSTHNGFSPTQDYHPVNLDHGLYWLGNRMLFGIYYHDNHHAMVKAFNPMNCTAQLEERARHRMLRQSSAAAP